MLLQIPDVLSPDEVRRAHSALERAEWVDGRVTAGHQSARAKNNRQIPEGSPAARENLRAGDRISKIDGRTTVGMKMTEVLKWIRGTPETRVRLTIERAGDPKPREVELVREVINIESVLGDRRGEDGGWRFQLESDPRIAHVRIASFGERTPMELERVLASVIANGAKAIALDLRGDAGGSLESAVAVCQMLLPTGRQIVKTRGREGALRASYTTTEDGAFLDVPLVVLVNQDSASASEIVTGALQVHRRALIVGERTFGKGSVQQVLRLNNNNSAFLKLTTAHYYLPDGRCLHREEDSVTWGVDPDVEVKLVPKEMVKAQNLRLKTDILKGMFTASPTADASKVKVPTQVIYGTQSNTVNKVDADNLARAIGPSAQVIPYEGGTNLKVVVPDGEAVKFDPNDESTHVFGARPLLSVPRDANMLGKISTFLLASIRGGKA